MSKRPWRPATAPPDLDDFRHLYRKMMVLDERLSVVQGELFMLKARIEEDRKYLSAIVSNLNQLIILLTEEGDPRRPSK